MSGCSSPHTFYGRMFHVQALRARSTAEVREALATLKARACIWVSHNNARLLAGKQWPCFFGDPGAARYSETALSSLSRRARDSTQGPVHELISGDLRHPRSRTRRQPTFQVKTEQFFAASSGGVHETAAWRAPRLSWVQKPLMYVLRFAQMLPNFAALAGWIIELFKSVDVHTSPGNRRV